MIQRPKRLLATLVATVALVLSIGGTAAAVNPPGVTPASVTNTMLPGQSMSIAKSVQTSTIPPNPDLVFLADTTGSMGSAIANVQANAINVMNTVIAAQPTSQVGSSRVDLQACKLEYSIVSPK